jgi:hypothetical protein
LLLKSNFRDYSFAECLPVRTNPSKIAKTKLQKMQINATITGLQYQVFLANELETTKSKDFDINTCPTSCIYSDKRLNFAVSKWVSPKRTRSYPYERDTKKRITQ